MTIPELAYRIARLMDVVQNRRHDSLPEDDPDAAILKALADRVSDGYAAYKSDGLDFGTCSVRAFADTIQHMLDQELGGSMTAAEWHKIADERSAEIVRLMGTCDQLTTMRDNARLERDMAKMRLAQVSPTREGKP